MKKCLCGCGAEVSSGKRFLTGHDRKLEAALARAMGGTERLKQLVEAALGRKVTSAEPKLSRK